MLHFFFQDHDVPVWCVWTGFNKPSELLQQRRTYNHRPKFICPSCKKITRKDNLERHIRKHRNENNHHCPDCLRVSTRRDALDNHFEQHHGQTWESRKGSNKWCSWRSNAHHQMAEKNDDPRQFYTLTKTNSTS